MRETHLVIAFIVSSVFKSHLRYYDRQFVEKSPLLEAAVHCNVSSTSFTLSIRDNVNSGIEVLIIRAVKVEARFSLIDVAPVLE